MVNVNLFNEQMFQDGVVRISNQAYDASLPFDLITNKNKVLPAPNFNTFPKTLLLYKVCLSSTQLDTIQQIKKDASKQMNKLTFTLKTI